MKIEFENNCSIKKIILQKKIKIHLKNSHIKSIYDKKLITQFFLILLHKNLFRKNEFTDY